MRVLLLLRASSLPRASSVTFRRRHIWHRDPFLLAPFELPGAGGPGGGMPCLYGRTYWGEDIEDEWFIVWLVRRRPRPCVLSECQER